MSMHSAREATQIFRFPNPATPLSTDDWSSKPLTDLEDRLIWSREWVAIGHSAQLPQPGDILPFTVGNHGIHVERMPDGGLVARFNFVQHGGCRSIPLQCQTGTRTRCSYLSCGYSRDRVEGFPTSLNRSDPAAHHYLGFDEVPRYPISLLVGGGVIFVNLDPAKATDRAPHGIAPLTDTVESRTIEPPCNWKNLWHALLGDFIFEQTQGSALRGRSIQAPEVGLSAILPNFFMMDFQGLRLAAILQPTGTRLTLLRLALAGDGDFQPLFDLLERSAGRVKTPLQYPDYRPNKLQKKLLAWLDHRLTGEDSDIVNEGVSL